MSKGKWKVLVIILIIISALTTFTLVRDIYSETYHELENDITMLKEFQRTINDYNGYDFIFQGYSILYLSLSMMYLFSKKRTEEDSQKEESTIIFYGGIIHVILFVGYMLVVNISVQSNYPIVKELLFYSSLNKITYVLITLILMYNSFLRNQERI